MPVDVALPEVFDILLEASLPDTLSSDEGKLGKSNCCATTEMLSQLAIHKFGESLPENENGEAGSDCVTCHICLDDFEHGDDLRTLPCCHSFHMRCVDVWLTEKSSCCPVCRSDCGAAGSASSP